MTNTPTPAGTETLQTLAPAIAEPSSPSPSEPAAPATAEPIKFVIGSGIWHGIPGPALALTYAPTNATAAARWDGARWVHAQTGAPLSENALRCISESRLQSAYDRYTLAKESLSTIKSKNAPVRDAATAELAAAKAKYQATMDRLAKENESAKAEYAGSIADKKALNGFADELSPRARADGMKELGLKSYETLA